MERNPTWEADSHFAFREIPCLKEPEGLLPYTQQTIVGSHAEPPESSLRPSPR